MHKLGKNHGAYFGETIEIEAVLAQTISVARAHGWQIGQIPVRDGMHLWTLRRVSVKPRKSIYISTGIHGDEPAGPLATLRLLQNNVWPAGVEVWLNPCLNPTGFPLNKRENADGMDLNRDYLHLQTAEIRAHSGWLKTLPNFAVSLCLHEDWESHGFYVYELNPDQQPSHAQAIVEEVRRVCPIDLSPEIEGRAASGGIINPNVDPKSRPQWPEAFYLITHKTRLSYTLEAPSDFPLLTRVAALVAGVNAVLKRV